MFGLKDLSVDFLTGSPLLVGGALVVLLTLSFLLYFRTNPPLPLYLRIILGALRMIAVLTLIAALFEPVFHFDLEYQRQPHVSALVDVSSSMDRDELGVTRRSRLDSLMSTSEFGYLESNTDLHSWYFGSDIQTTVEQVNRDETAIGDAIHELAGRELADPSEFWLLFTDGKSNSGSRPADAARGLSVPVYTIDMASDAGSFDVGLSGIDFNPVVFVGQRSEIKVRLNWRGAANQTLTVQVRDGERVLDDEVFILSQEDGFGEVALNYVPSEPGRKLLRIRVPALEGEESTSNNERTVAVKVLKSRLMVLLVTTNPDYELGFLHRYLLLSEKYDVKLITTGAKSGNIENSFPSRQTELNRYDLLILHDPELSALTAHQSLIRSYLTEKGGAIWVMLDSRYEGRKGADWFNDLLPFSQSVTRPIEYVDFQGEPVEEHLFHPAIRLADQRSSIRETWATLPPFKSLVLCDQINTNGVVLAEAAGPGFDNRDIPILGYLRHGPGKLMTSAALPFWHWGFVNLGFGEDDSHYRGFLEGVISWLTIPEDFDPIRVTPVKEVFNRGEQIRFEGFVFDQGFRPIPGVTGTVQLVMDDSGESFESDLIEKGQGKFVAEFSSIPPGKYSYHAVFEKGEQLLKQMDGDVLVESFSLEEFDQRGDPNSLIAVAQSSGGKYYTYRQFSEALAEMDLSPITELEKVEIVLWGKLWLLLLLLGTLAVEWTLRKVYHLI
jgi:hypothetical protein